MAAYYSARTAETAYCEKTKSNQQRNHFISVWLMINSGKQSSNLCGIRGHVIGLENIYKYIIKVLVLNLYFLCLIIVAQ